MEFTSFLSVLGVFLGLVAALFFCWGAAEMTAKAIWFFSGSTYGASPGLRRFMVVLKADYLAGSFALILSFLFQILGAAPLPELVALDGFESVNGPVMLSFAISIAVAGALLLYRRWVITSVESELATLDREAS